MIDILKQYEKQFPKAQEKKMIQSGPEENYGFFVRLVIKFSNGAVKDETRANLVLLIVTIAFIAAAIAIYFLS